VPLLNLGILAHVDAGKTTLTERLLFAAGVIDEVGSVDAGSTQTDSLALERQRGITIKSAVAAFTIGDVAVNLIDTPGHPDFIAEVERVLSVLDGAVLVISAVEGVQAQTRVLMRTLQRLNIPTIIFVNKIDRGGARPAGVLQEVAARLTPAIVPMGNTTRPGTGSAEFAAYGPADAAFAESLAGTLADRDDELLAAYVAGANDLPYGRLRTELAAQARRCQVHPVFFGSAMTGAGVDCLTAGIAELLPAAGGDPDGPVSGSVFKVERGPAGEKVAYARMFSGTVRVRDRVLFGNGSAAKVTAISVFDHGSAAQRSSVAAGHIARLWGLADVQIGDALGVPGPAAAGHHFAPPTLETVVVPDRQADKAALHAALTQLAEQDPLINLRQDDVKQELLVSLYGEVQKEVIQATLVSDFGLDVGFRETTVICIERPIGTGESAEIMHGADNPFLATVGLRIEPALVGSGVEFRLAVGIRQVPMYVYKTADSFIDLMTQYIRHTLREGLSGWQVTDCVVIMTDCGYSSPGTTAADFRKLTPVVLMAALQKAGTQVCEPIDSFRLDFPADCMPALLAALPRLRAVPQVPEIRGSSCVVDGEIPTGQVHALQQQLPPLARGEGTLESQFARYQPVSGRPPTRPRTDANPLNRSEYLLHVQRGIAGGG
jgi:ribosomal protection tetracycline resistance protein